MARVTVEDCLDQLESRFALVHLAVRRVLQLRHGVMPLVEAPKNKEVVVALREIAAGKVSMRNIRQFEEMEALPERTSAARQNIMQQEVKEIMESAAQSNVSPDFEGKTETFGEEEEY